MPGKPEKRHPVTQPSDSSYRLIALTQNQTAIVDAEDFEWLSKWCWHAFWHDRTKSFYAVRNDRSTGKHTTVKMHRAIMGFPKEDVDHKNRNTLDNRKQNLRLADKFKNAWNRGIRSDNAIGLKGVFAHTVNPGKWVAAAQGNYLGCFTSPEDAARAYDAYAKEHYGEFAVLNFPSTPPNQ